MENLSRYRGQSVLNDELLNMLQKSGCWTVMDFLDQDQTRFTEASRIPTEIFRTLRTFLLRKFASPSINAAKLMEIKRKNKENEKSLMFDVASVDELLCGEFRSGQILELCGMPLTGKTQLLLKLIVTALQTDDFSRILWIDSSGSFNPKRLFDLTKDAGLNEDQIKVLLTKVDVASVSSCERLLQLLDFCTDWNKKNSTPPGSSIVIIDSLHTILSPLIGVTDFSEYGLLNAVGQALGYLSDSLGMTVVYTNSAVSDDNENFAAGLGLYWSSVPHHRLLLKSSLPIFVEESESDFRKFTATLLKSTSLSCIGEAEFKISKNGCIF